MNEKDIDKLIANEDRDVEEGLDDDDLQSSCDIEEFERKLKNAKNFKDLADSDSDDDLPGTSSKSRPTTAPNNKNSKQVKFVPQESYDLMYQVNTGQKNSYQTTQKKSIQQLQNEVSKVKQDAKPKTEEEKVMDLIGTKNETAKDKKLKELVQKNKELYVSYETEKTKRQRLEKDLAKIKEDTELQLNAMEGKVPKNAKAGEDIDWKKKYTALEKTLQEERVKSTTLKNDLNKAVRIISREIGGDFDIDQVLSEENSWKGRAQQIEVLKAKVKELQGKVNDSLNVSRMSNTQTSDFDNVSMRTSGTVLGGKAKERREEIESLKGLVEQLKTENDSLAEKAKAANARKAILEKEIKEIKSDYEKNKKILIEKSENDDKFITALKRELDKVKNTPPNYQTRIVYRDKPVESTKKDGEESDEVTKKEILFLQSELDKKEKIIKELINDKLKKDGVTSMNSTQNGITNKENQNDREKVVRLEATIRALKQENDDLVTQKFGVNANSSDGKLIKELSTENAKLRRKIDDLQQKVDGAKK